MTETETFPWSDGYLVGYPPMDEVHHEFVGLVDALLSCPDAESLERLKALAQHAESHFGDELEWMQASGFPALQCHAGEHAAVLASVGDVLRRVEDGDVEIARRLAAALASWFPGHASHMDAALARWLLEPGSGERPFACEPGTSER